MPIPMSPSSASLISMQHDSSTSRRVFLNIDPEDPQISTQSTASVNKLITATFYCSNEIKSSKYTMLNFIPKNLFEQFRRAANWFFLAICVIQFFPQFRTIDPIVASLPFVLVMALTGVKDSYEDYKRHVSDREINNYFTSTLDNFVNANTEYAEKHLRDPLLVYKATFTKIKDLFVCFWVFPFSIWKRGQKLTEPTPADKVRATEMARIETANKQESVPEINVISASPLENSFVERPLGGHATTATSEPKIRTDGAVSDSFRVEGNGEDYPANRPEFPAWKQALWRDIQVGDIIFLKNNDSIPADTVIISTSEVDCMCYVETKNLDGETNLKIRRGVMETSHVKTPQDCLNLRLYVDAERPNNNLYSFNGSFIIHAGVRSRSNSNSVDKPKRIGGMAVSISCPDMRKRSLEQPPHSHTLVVPGGLEAGKVRLPLNINSILLRGCVLRNTEWAIGIALYTGKDTKVVLNSGKTPSKTSKLDREANPLVLFNLLILFVLCISCAIQGPLWINSREKPPAPYLSDEDATSSNIFTGFIAFLNSVVAFQNIVPISFYITIEIVKVVQALFIHYDVDMYYEPTNRRCLARTYNLSDDLGRIEYIFSDKTGTLTRNVMEFKRCSIAGVVYKNDIEAPPASAVSFDKSNSFHMTPSPMPKTAPLSPHLNFGPSSPAFPLTPNGQACGIPQFVSDGFMSENPYLKDVPVPYQSTMLMTHCQQNNDEGSRMIKEFMRVLSVCHSVLATQPDPEKPNLIEYKAQSPDEAALVDSARANGFAFLKRDSVNVYVDVFGKVEVYELLNVVEFNSTRKRMSVIVKRPEGDIALYCKGADTVIFERLSEGQQVMMDVTTQHLESFAREGLRTLCLSYVILDPEEYQAWSVEYMEANLSLNDREVKMDLVAERIEKNLILLGSTAIEDKLQEGVPECIALLAQAGIKLWVLTGDKMETAINIGYSCNLLTEDSNLIVVKGGVANESDSTMRQMSNAIDQFFSPGAGPKIMLKRPSDSQVAPESPMKSANEEKKSRGPIQMITPESESQPHALIIDGSCLKYALDIDQKDLFLNLASKCSAVICCRVSPLQKAKVVDLVRSEKKAMCLAIGDGANDVSMIQAAHVGIGIAGEEGLQAVMASDYAFSQFRFLGKLLFVHGHWAFRRNSTLILNFFFKNLIWTLPLFWYQFYCGFSNAYLYDYWWLILFNTLFTATPTISYGIFDRDIKQHYALAFPAIYAEGSSSQYFGVLKFSLYAIDALYQSVMCFYIPYGVFLDAAPFPTGRQPDLVHFGAAGAIITILNANLAVAIDTNSWTLPQTLCVFGPNVFVFVWLLISDLVGTTTQPQIADLYREILGSASFWLVLLVTVTVCVLPRITAKYVLRTFFPGDTDIVQEIQKYKLPIHSVGGPRGKKVEGQFDDRRKSIALSARSEMTMTMMKTGETRVNRGFAFSQDIGTRDILMGRELRRLKTWGPELLTKIQNMSVTSLQRIRSSPGKASNSSLDSGTTRAGRTRKGSAVKFGEPPTIMTGAINFGGITSTRPTISIPIPPTVEEESATDIMHSNSAE